MSQVGGGDAEPSWGHLLDGGTTIEFRILIQIPEIGLKFRVILDLKLDYKLNLKLGNNLGSTEHWILVQIP